MTSFTLLAISTSYTMTWVQFAAAGCSRTKSFGLGLHFRSSGKNSDNILYHIYLFEVPMAITGRFTASIIPPRSKMLTQPLGTSE